MHLPVWQIYIIRYILYITCNSYYMAYKYIMHYLEYNMACSKHNI